MGVSSDGIIVFGIEMDDENPPEFMDDFDDFDEYVDHLNGLTDADYKARSEARKACPADLTLHCSYDYSMYILAVRGTETRAYRGSPKAISSFDVDPAKLAEFKAWCIERGIENPEPKWLLCSMYG